MRCNIELKLKLEYKTVGYSPSIANCHFNYNSSKFAYVIHFQTNGAQAIILRSRLALTLMAGVDRKLQKFFFWRNHWWVTCIEERSWSELDGRKWEKDSVMFLLLNFKQMCWKWNIDEVWSAKQQTFRSWLMNVISKSLMMAAIQTETLPKWNI